MSLEPFIWKSFHTSKFKCLHCWTYSIQSTLLVFIQTREFGISDWNFSMSGPFNLCASRWCASQTWSSWILNHWSITSLENGLRFSSWLLLLSICWQFLLVSHQLSRPSSDEESLERIFQLWSLRECKKERTKHNRLMINLRINLNPFSLMSLINSLVHQ